MVQKPVEENERPAAGKVRATLERSIFFISWPFFMLTLLLPVYGREIGAEVVEIGLYQHVGTSVPFYANSIFSCCVRYCWPSSYTCRLGLRLTRKSALPARLTGGASPYPTSGVIKCCELSSGSF
jgi:hypothetical protein